MKGQNNDIPFIKNSFGEDDYLKVNNIKNNIFQKNDQNSTQDLSLTVHMDENENNIKMNEKEIKEIKKNFFKLKKIGNLIIISEDEKNDDSKKNGKINNKNRLKNSIAPDNSNIENLMNKKDIYIKIAIIISDILTIMGAVLNMANSLIGNKLTLIFGYSKNDNSLEELVMN